jgi:glycosyltransferase involved in cell wall biosynthesis
MRKNHVGLIEAWLRATRSDDDAVLILKVGTYNPGSHAEFQWQLQKAQQRAGRSLADAAPLHIVTDLFPDADMPRVYAAGTHYISVSFGEGWDLSMIQAASTGLKLIAPQHSAYTAYLDDEIATFISATEQPAIPPGAAWSHEFFINAKWWLPDLDEAVAAIRAAIDGKEAPKQSPRDRIAEQFNWERAGDRLIEILEEAEAMAGSRRGG